MPFGVNLRTLRLRGLKTPPIFLIQNVKYILHHRIPNA